MKTHIYRRQYERIHLSASAKIYFEDKVVEGLRTKDISLSGIYVLGKLQFYPFEACQLSIKGRWLETESIVLDCTARKSRQDYCGTAFQFTQMNHETFEMLQTFLLYNSSDPIGLGREFASHCPFDVWNQGPKLHDKNAKELTC
ncbi:PilZ domain-containing protein [Desulforhopalus sp. IMCC35007]|uniref:PilZ domain-containing protein n=1 Tax=Desulforhopalus sp. IMCC35007 TaxID=2569543 RepID=UPI0010AE3F15|nr:PilZ domain-containing protein [Desulforhopalus sp. IMCC35007]TKB11728.1 PilZ domain-containing protein [Desulforhopalus sp. IMCC35007]